MNTSEIIFFLVLVYIFLDIEDMLIVAVVILITPFLIINLVIEGISMIWKRE